MELHNLPLENVSPDEAYPNEFVAQILLEEDKYWYHTGLGGGQVQDLWSHLWPVIFCTSMAIGGMRSADEDTEMKDVTNTK